MVRALVEQHPEVSFFGQTGQETAHTAGAEGFGWRRDRHELN